MGWVGSGSLIWMGELGVHCRVQIAAYRICALAMNKFGTGSRLEVLLRTKVRTSRLSCER